MNQVREVQTWRQVRGPAGAVMCETRDLGNNWPYWNGGAQQTLWKMLLEMKRFNRKAKEEVQGAVALVLDLAKAFDRVSFPVGLGNALQLPKKDLASAVREGCVAEPAPNYHGELPASTSCAAGCVG